MPNKPVVATPLSYAELRATPVNVSQNMKIADYITKHQVKALVHSDVAPAFIPNDAFSKRLLLPSFAGANAEGSVFVTTYQEEGFFVVYEKDKRRIVGKMTEDSKDLG